MTITEFLKKNEWLLKILLAICSILGVSVFFINVITIQSYPTVGGEWKVEFKTYSTKPTMLSISGFNGTEFDKDLDFLSLNCGDTEVIPIRDNNTYSVNWYCNEIGTFITTPKTAGKHTLEFKFGNDKEYAYNTAYEFIIYLPNSTSPEVVNFTGGDKLQVEFNITNSSGTLAETGVTVLNITIGDTICPLIGGTPVSFTEQITDTNNDATEWAGTTIVEPYSHIYGDYDGTSQNVGYRFTVDIPQGAKIINANLTDYLNSYNVTHNNIWNDLYADDVDNSPVFTTSDNNITIRAKTTAKIHYNVDVPVYGGDPIISPNISSIIQEVINRANWVSGNGLSILSFSNLTATGDTQWYTAFDVTSEAGEIYYGKLMVEYLSGNEVGYNSAKKRWIANCTVPNLGKVGRQNLTIFVNVSGTILNTTGINAVDFGNKTQTDISLKLNNSATNISVFQGGVFNISLGTTYFNKNLSTNITTNLINGTRVIVSNPVLSCDIPIIWYHSITNSTTAGDINESIFSQEMEYLYNNSYKVMSLGGFYSEYTSNNRCPVDKTIVIGFDDNYANHRTFVMPILQSYGFNATFNPTIEFMNDSGRLNDTQLAEIHNAGFEIATQMYNDTPAVNCTTANITIRNQINDSLRYLETDMGFRTITTYIFPYNLYNVTCSKIWDIVDDFPNLKATYFSNNAYYSTAKVPVYNGISRYGVYSLDNTVSFDNFKIWLSYDKNYKTRWEFEGYYDSSLYLGPYDAFLNDSVGTLQFDTLGNSFNFTILIPETGNYSFRIRRTTGTDADWDNYGERYNYTICGTEYDSSKYHMEDDMPDILDSNYHWGFDVVDNILVSKGLCDFRITDNTGGTTEVDYLQIEKVNSNLTYEINTSYFNVGNFTITANVGGDSDYLSNTTSLGLEIKAITQEATSVLTAVPVINNIINSWWK